MTDWSGEDVELKAAVRRCWADGRAPAELRQSIMALCRDDQTRLPPSLRMTIGHRLWQWPAAAAAILLVSLGVWYHGGPAGPPSDGASVLPVELTQSLIRTHDRCAQKADHQGLAVARSDDAAIGVALRSQLSRPVLVARPTEPGWRFTGAAVCTVGSTRSAHLVFRNAGDALSIFSLPATALPSVQNGSQFCATTNDHILAGFVKDGSVFCLVGSGRSGQWSAQRLEGMRDRMEARVVAQRPSVPSETELVASAEMLHTVQP